MPAFSIAVLTHNEAQFLPRLLDSMGSFRKCGGEVIVLDDSTDGTAELALSKGCKVHPQGDRFRHTVSRAVADELNAKFVMSNELPLASVGQQVFDFAAARNFLASLSSHEMVAMPDADEVFASLDLGRIDEAIEGGTTAFKSGFIFSHDKFGRPGLCFDHKKFYDRRKFKWDEKFLVHESLVGEGKEERLPDNVFMLEHWPNPAASSTSALTGLALAQYLYPCARNSHYLAREMFYKGMYRSAIKEFKNHIAMNEWIVERAQSMVYIGDCYGLLGLPDKQIEWYHKAFDLDSSRREPLMRLAEASFRKKDAVRTACYAAAALEIPRISDYFTTTEYYRQAPHDMLYWAKWQLGDRDAAKTHWEKAIAYEPNDPRYQVDTQWFRDLAFKSNVEGWMTPLELEHLYLLAKEMDSVVEIGSWKGRSTGAFCAGCPGTVTAIDHFMGSKGFLFEEKVHTRAAFGDAVYKDFCENTKQYTNLVVNRKESLEAVNDYPDKSFDLVFIDAEHTYEGCAADIKAWGPKAKKILCGHDYGPEWPSVRRAVDEFVGPVEVTGTVWSKRIGEYIKGHDR